MIRRTSALYLILILLTAQTSVAAKLCSNIFTPRIEETIKALAELRLSIDLAQAQGQHSIERSVMAVHYAKKEKELISYLVKNSLMTMPALREKIKQEISELQKNAKQSKEADSQKIKQQSEVLTREVIHGYKIVLHPIQPGSFKMDPESKNVEVTLTKPFEMMSTVTTQFIWEKIVNLYKAQFTAPLAALPLEPYPSYFKGDELRPVENVSPSQIARWIEQLNQLSQAGEPSLEQIIRGHKAGDIYRLPTEAEWEFVIRGRGQFNEAYHFGDDINLLDLHAWYKNNSHAQTHPVAQKKPLIVHGKEFYDMHGNVGEILADAWELDLRGGKDPFVASSRAHLSQVVRGGNWFYNDILQNSSGRSWQNTHEKSNHTGFRLVREVRP